MGFSKSKEINYPAGVNVEIIAAVLLTALVIDFFFDSNAVVGIVAIWISTALTVVKLDVSWMWLILTTILISIIFSAIYWYLIRLLRGVILKKVEGKALWVDTGNGAVGKKGEVKIINGTLMLYWNGDLWPVSTEKSDLESGDKVTILSFKDGEFEI